MRKPRSVLVQIAAVTAAVAFTALSAGPALASGHTILRSGFEGITPQTTNPPGGSPTIAGVNPGGAPWTVAASSNTRVREDGRVTVQLRHLIIPGRGNPIAMMAASLVCDDMVVDSTKAFAMSPEGNGHVRDRISEVDNCKDATLLIRNATDPAGLGAYFAVAMHH